MVKGGGHIRGLTVKFVGGVEHKREGGESRIKSGTEEGGGGKSLFRVTK